jgi:hypothetical protein
VLVVDTYEDEDDEEDFNNDDEEEEATSEEHCGAYSESCDDEGAIVGAFENEDEEDNEVQQPYGH